MNVKTGLPEGKKQETRLLDLEKTILEKQLYSTVMIIVLLEILQKSLFMV